jgi:mRNA interferase RelE/StbE
MSYTLRYHPDVKKSDLPKIDHKNKAMLKKAIEERLVLHPEIYGKPLQRTLKGYWKFRVGNYRVIFKISGSDILILGIIHRKEVYRQIETRAE